MTLRPALLALALFATSALANGGDGGVAGFEPMPTADQCLKLGSPQVPLSFGPGEELEYDLDALGAKAGTMVMRTLPRQDGALPIEVTVETNTFFSKVRRVRGTGTSYLNPRTLRPKRYHEDAKENEVHRVADVTFKGDRSVKLVSTIDGHTGTYTLPHGQEALDVAGTMYLLRQLPLKAGTRVCFDAYGIRRIWRVWGTVQPAEHVSLPVGEFEAWHLAGQAARLDMSSARREIHVWISNDSRRLPLAALGTIDLGVVRATLKGVHRPGEVKARAENKANLKW